MVTATQVRAAVGLALALAALPAGAQVARSGGGGAAQQAIQQLQQLAAERTALQAENARLKQDLEAAKAAQAAAEKKAAALQARVAGAAAQAQRGASAAAAEQQLAQTRTRLDELVARFRETGEQLRTMEGERNTLRSELGASQRAAATCATHNAELYQIASDVLTRYEGSGFGDTLARKEPFTRVARNRLENLVDGYREQLETLRSPPPAAPPPATKPADKPAATP